MPSPKTNVFYIFIILFLVTSCNKLKPENDQRLKLQNIENTNIFFNQLVSKFKSTNNLDGFHKSIDKARMFVQKYSDHRNEHTLCADKTCLQRMSKEFLDHINLSAPSPSMNCGHRTFILGQLLDALGYQTRRVNLLNPDKQGHVFLEVLNPETKKWEITDADFNVYFENERGRLGLVDLIYDDPKTYKPCSEKKCDWNDWHSKDAGKPYFLIEAKYFSIGFIESDKAFINKDILKNRLTLEEVQKITSAKQVLFKKTP